MTIPITSLNAARTICEIRDWKVSNLEIHKILYIAHGAYMAIMGTANRPLIPEIFQAWAYGPVEPSLYHKIKMFRSSYVRDYALAINDETEDSDCDKDAVTHIKKVMGWLKDYEPYQLVAITHASGGAWEKNYFPRQSNIILDEHIFDEYKTYWK